MYGIKIPTGTLKDERQREVVFLSHCILNENKRYLGGAFCPGAMTNVVGKWMDRGVGIVQMPCPEQRVWGGVNKTWMWLHMPRRELCGNMLARPCSLYFSCIPDCDTEESPARCAG